METFPVRIAIRFGRKWVAVDTKDMVIKVGVQMGLSKSQIKRLLKQNGIEIRI